MSDSAALLWAMMTSCSGFFAGSGRRKKSLTSENTVALTVSPSASVSTTTAEKPGLLARMRTA